MAPNSVGGHTLTDQIYSVANLCHSTKLKCNHIYSSCFINIHFKRKIRENLMWNYWNWNGNKLLTARFSHEKKKRTQALMTRLHSMKSLNWNFKMVLAIHLLDFSKRNDKKKNYGTRVEVILGSGPMFKIQAFQRVFLHSLGHFFFAQLLLMKLNNATLKCH